MADFNALHREFAPRGVRVLAVSVDADNGSRVRRFVEGERLAFTVGLDPDRRVDQVFQVVGVPETFVIGKDGRLVWRHIGNVHAVMDSVRAVLAGAVTGS
jgi:peroxiredoxin